MKTAVIVAAVPAAVVVAAVGLVLLPFLTLVCLADRPATPHPLADPPPRRVPPARRSSPASGPRPLPGLVPADARPPVLPATFRCPGPPVRSARAGAPRVSGRRRTPVWIHSVHAWGASCRSRPPWAAPDARLGP